MVDLDSILEGLRPRGRRREDREAAQGSVKIAGAEYRLIDWSSSGFQANGAVDALKEGLRVPIEFNVTIGEQDYFFECNAFIVRADSAKKRFAGVFVDMDERDRLAVDQYFEESMEICSE